MVNVEVEESFDIKIKVSKEFIDQLREEAERQKATRNVESLLNAISDSIEYKPLFESVKDTTELLDGFEITEE